MAEPKRGFFRGLLGLVDVRRWMGYDTVLVPGAKAIKTMVVGLTTQLKPEHQETFEEATARMGLSEPQLQARSQELFKTAFIAFFCASVGSVYGVYLFFMGAWETFLIVVPLSVLAWGHWFRAYFWWYQIRERRLGCDWRTCLLNIIQRRSHKN